MQKIEIKCLTSTTEELFDCILDKLDKIKRNLPQIREELKKLNFKLADIYHTECKKDLDCFLPIMISELKKFFKEKGYELEVVQKCIQDS